MTGTQVQKFTLAVLLSLSPGGLAQQADRPHILLDQSLRAVEYQLNRLTNDELSRVERKTDEAKYRPVYVALLTRKGMAKEFRDEAVAALVKMDRATPARVLLDALGRIPVSDEATADKLTAILLAQSPAILRQQRDDILLAIAPTLPFIALGGGARPAGVVAQDPASFPPAVLRAARAALVVADGAPEAWTRALTDNGPLVPLLGAVRLIPSPELRSLLFEPVVALVTGTAD